MTPFHNPRAAGSVELVRTTGLAAVPFTVRLPSPPVPVSPTISSFPSAKRTMVPASMVSVGIDPAGSFWT